MGYLQGVTAATQVIIHSLATAAANSGVFSFSCLFNTLLGTVFDMMTAGGNAET